MGAFSIPIKVFPPLNMGISPGDSEITMARALFIAVVPVADRCLAPSKKRVDLFLKFFYDYIRICG
jgi:hypothetical protein